MARIAKVVVEIALDREFDYLIPESLRESVRLGCRVSVPFGSRRQTTGYVVGLAESSAHQGLKAIASLQGEKPILDESVLKLARWISEYYCSPIEKAIGAVLPVAIRRKGARHKARLFATPTGASSEAAVEALRSASPVQAAALEFLLARGGAFLGDVERATGASGAQIRALVKRGLLTVAPQVMTRDPLLGQVILPTQPLPLMSQQTSALDVVKKSIHTLDPSVVLLHGVTGSGKTEIYLQAIDCVLGRDQGAIVLVPEISLTPQTVERFRSRFGERIAVLHSSLSDGERHDEWYRIREGKARIVIGARSAVFAPVQRPGLIVVDEEHEGSYKQEEAPCYNARDVAVMRGRIEGCAVLLGSATPSLESWWNVQRGKYAICVLPHRVDHRKMPMTRILDMRRETDLAGRPSVFSRDLIEAMRLRLARGEQTILFLNRRGYASSLICPKCGYVAMCDRCSVAYTYHKHTENLLCHICGAVRRVPGQCPECGDRAFRYAGLGTQRVEAIVRKILPEARVQRMDADATTRKDSHRRILGEFRVGKIDILVGTQMIAKGLDFPNVTLIGVIYADLSLHVPDFRAGERTFQLLTQVAGRAGRGDVPGEVIVQTYTPLHPAVEAVRRSDFAGFYQQELATRREYEYPPFSHLVCITVRSRTEEKVAFSTEALVKRLSELGPAKVAITGPMPAPLARAKGYHRYQVLLRGPTARAITEPLRRVLAAFAWPPGVAASVDVDALSLM